MSRDGEVDVYAVARVSLKVFNMSFLHRLNDANVRTTADRLPDTHVEYAPRTPGQFSNWRLSYLSRHPLARLRRIIVCQGILGSPMLGLCSSHDPTANLHGSFIQTSQ
jgi:hypothetical protein